MASAWLPPGCTLSKENGNFLPIGAQPGNETHGIESIVLDSEYEPQNTDFVSALTGETLSFDIVSRHSVSDSNSVNNIQDEQIKTGPTVLMPNLCHYQKSCI